MGAAGHRRKRGGASDAVVTAMAGRIRSLYIRARRQFEEAASGCASDWGASPQQMVRWDGGVDGCGRRYVSLWLKVAALALERKLDPGALVWCLFDIYLRREEAPLPSCLLSAPVLKAAESFGERFAAVRASTLLSSLSAAQRRYEDLRRLDRWSETQVWRAVIDSPSADVSCLVRYCLAARLGLVDLASKYRDRALEEYGANPQSCQVLGDLLADDLRAGQAP